MNFPAYPHYKPSGVEWLGDVPEHWEIQLLRYITRLAYGNSLSADDRESGEIAVYGSNGQIGSHVQENTLAPVIVVGRKGSFGKVNFSKTSVFAIDTTYFIDQSQTKSHLRWLYYLLDCLRLDSISKDSAVPGLAREDAYSNCIAFPPTAEQQAIAIFLDYETGKLDSLVAKKREFIERLKEKRTALISHTVTRGLPPDAARAAGIPKNPPLKPSGIEWIGDIPAHWNIVPLRYAFHNFDNRRIPLSGEERATKEKIYPYYGASGIIDYVDEFLFNEILILVAEDGANLLSRSSPLAFLASGKYWVNNHAHILKPIIGDIRFWTAVLQIFDYTPLVTGAAQPKLTGERLGSICLPMPPATEQSIIADYLHNETMKLDLIVAKVEEAVERLQEYRAALISSAITGKIDVRKATQ